MPMGTRMMRGVCHVMRIGLAAIALQGGPAAGQSYPAGPRRVVVPDPPGGGTDFLARAIAQKPNESWSQPVVVDNRGGANGTIGTALVAKAVRDGHTMLLVPMCPPRAADR